MALSRTQNFVAIKHLKYVDTCKLYVAIMLTATYSTGLDLVTPLSSTVLHYNNSTNCMHRVFTLVGLLDQHTLLNLHHVVGDRTKMVCVTRPRLVANNG